MKIEFQNTFEEFAEAQAAVAKVAERSASGRMWRIGMSVGLLGPIIVGLPLLNYFPDLALSWLIPWFALGILLWIFVMVWYWRRKETNRIVMGLLLAVAIATIAMQIAVNQTNRWAFLGSIWKVLGPHMGWFVLFGLLTWYVMVIARRTMRKTWDNAPYLGDPRTVETSPVGLTMSTPLSRSEFRWGRFSDVLETRNLLILAAGNQVFCIIPKRVMSGDQLDELRALAAIVKTGKSGGFEVIPMATRAPPPGDPPPVP